MTFAYAFKCLIYITPICLLVESEMIPVAIFLSPAVIPGPSDDGTVNIKSNSSSLSSILSGVTGMLTFFIVAPRVNVAINVGVLKSILPVTQNNSTKAF